jgi:hypothetical protein
MTRYAIAVALLLAGSAVIAQSQEGSGAKGRQFVTTPGVPKVSVAPGKKASIEFPFEVGAGYHVNSHQPTSEELIPTQLVFTAPSDLVISGLQYPAGELMSFPFDPSVKLSVYSGSFVIKASLLAPAKVATGAHTIHGELRYQACDNRACYPPKSLPVDFVVGVARPKKHPKPNRQSPHVH